MVVEPSNAEITEGMTVDSVAGKYKCGIVASLRKQGNLLIATVRWPNGIVEERGTRTLVPAK